MRNNSWLVFHYAVSLSPPADCVYRRSETQKTPLGRTDPFFFSFFSLPIQPLSESYLTDIKNTFRRRREYIALRSGRERKRDVLSSGFADCWLRYIGAVERSGVELYRGVRF